MNKIYPSPTIFAFIQAWVDPGGSGSTQCHPPPPPPPPTHTPTQTPTVNSVSCKYVLGPVPPPPTHTHTLAPTPARTRTPHTALSSSQKDSGLMLKIECGHHNSFSSPPDRHPSAPRRPSFEDLTRQLSLPDTKLLKWSDEDKSVHPEAAQLGADLLCGEELYKDLQTRYQRQNK